MYRVEVLKDGSVRRFCSPNLANAMLISCMTVVETKDHTKATAEMEQLEIDGKIQTRVYSEAGELLPAMSIRLHLKPWREYRYQLGIADVQSKVITFQCQSDLLMECFDALSESMKEYMSNQNVVSVWSLLSKLEAQGLIRVGAWDMRYNKDLSPEDVMLRLRAETSLEGGRA